MNGPPGESTSASEDLARLTRWEQSGGSWEVLAWGPGRVTIALLRCDGGEEMDRLTSADPAVRAHVESAAGPEATPGGG